MIRQKRKCAGRYDQPDKVAYKVSAKPGNVHRVIYPTQYMGFSNANSLQLTSSTRNLQKVEKKVEGWSIFSPRKAVG